MEGGVPRHMPEVVVALTGASGAKYCVRLIEALVEHKWSVRLIVTGTGAINLDLECSMTPSELASMNGVILEDNGNLAAKSASGSARFDAYVVCPASGTTIGKIAAGISDNLATRSALVAMKKRRKRSSRKRGRRKKMRRKRRRRKSRMRRKRGKKRRATRKKKRRHPSRSPSPASPRPR